MRQLCVTVLFFVLLVFTTQTMFAQQAPPLKGNLNHQPPSKFLKPPTPIAPTPGTRPPRLAATNTRPKLGAVVVFKESIAISLTGPRQHMAGYIQSVPKKSIAEKMGLQVGDELVLVNGVQVHSLQEYVAAAEQGQGKLALTVRSRNGKTRTLNYVPPVPPKPALPINVPRRLVLDQGNIVHKNAIIGHWVLTTNLILRYELNQPFKKKLDVLVFDLNNKNVHQEKLVTGVGGTWAVPHAAAANFGYIKFLIK